ncbi:hypothetical protein BH24GEM2_BH24GEM2_09460 [soil metagenome]
MAEKRETYIAGEGDASTPRTGSNMGDMDRMLDDTLASTERTDRTSSVRADDVEDIDIDYAGGGTTGRVSVDVDTDDPDAVRSEIKNTRERMSETIDEIEDALLRKKENIQERLNVFSPVQNNPLPSVGIAFGAGLLVGYLTADDDDDDDHHHPDDDHHHPDSDDDEFWSRRASDWEARARRLLDLAKRQEVELSELRGRGGVTGAAASATAGMAAAGMASRASGASAGSSSDTYEVTLEEDESRWSQLSSPLRSVGDTVVESLTSFLARATRELSGTQHR